MTDSQLTALSTIAWIVGTASVFIFLARWSDGGSWGIAAAVARGLVGWAGRNEAIAGEPPSADELPAIDASRLDRLWVARSRPGSGDAATGVDSAAAMDASPDSQPIAEIEDLGTRRIW